MTISIHEEMNYWICEFKYMNKQRSEKVNKIHINSLNDWINRSRYRLVNKSANNPRNKREKVLSENNISGKTDKKKNTPLLPSSY